MTAESKHIGIICSTGRTGTSYFASVLPEVIDGAFCVHEPDVWDGLTRKSLERIRRFGIYHMIIGRVMGFTGLRNLSQRYLAGKITLDGLAEAIRRQRGSYYESIQADLIIESNGQWFGVLPALPRVFRNYRIVGIIRDARTWLASTMNFGRVHGPRDWVTRLGFRRLDPELVGDMEYIGRWRSMNAFERVCWTWRGINTVLDKTIAADINGRMYRYEDLFLDSLNGVEIEDMLKFITCFPDRRFSHEFSQDLLGRRIHSVSRDAFPDWQLWDREHARVLQEICGPLMEKYGYGSEPKWLKLLG